MNFYATCGEVVHNNVHYLFGCGSAALGRPKNKKHCLTPSGGTDPVGRHRLSGAARVRKRKYRELLFAKSNASTIRQVLMTSGTRDAVSWETGAEGSNLSLSAAHLEN